MGEEWDLFNFLSFLHKESVSRNEDFSPANHQYLLKLRVRVTILPTLTWTNSYLETRRLN
jgi:hypothetical protein